MQLIFSLAGLVFLLHVCISAFSVPGQRGAGGALAAREGGPSGRARAPGTAGDGDAAAGGHRTGTATTRGGRGGGGAASDAPSTALVRARREGGAAAPVFVSVSGWPQSGTR